MGLYYTFNEFTRNNKRLSLKLYFMSPGLILNTTDFLYTKAWDKTQVTLQYTNSHVTL